VAAACYISTRLAEHLSSKPAAPTPPPRHHRPLQIQFSEPKPTTSQVSTSCHRSRLNKTPWPWARTAGPCCNPQPRRPLCTRTPRATCNDPFGIVLPCMGCMHHPEQGRVDQE
jgi:hypothetical protein